MKFVIFNLFVEYARWSDDVLEDVFANVRVDRAERVIKQVRLTVAVDGARQTHSLLLSSAQVDTLHKIYVLLSCRTNTTKLIVTELLMSIIWVTFFISISGSQPGGVDQPLRVLQK